MNDVNFKDMKITIKDTTKSMLSMNSKVKINNNEIAVEPNLIFQLIKKTKKQ